MCDILTEKVSVLMYLLSLYYMKPQTFIRSAARLPENCVMSLRKSSSTTGLISYLTVCHCYVTIITKTQIPTILHCFQISPVQSWNMAQTSIFVLYLEAMRSTSKIKFQVLFFVNLSSTLIGLNVFRKNYSMWSVKNSMNINQCQIFKFQYLAPPSGVTKK